MNDKQILTAEPGAPAAPRSVHIVDFLILMAERKRRLILYPLVAVCVASGFSLLMPNVYTATTRLLPPQQQQSSASLLLSQLGGAVGGALGGAAGLKNPNDLYVGMLKSRSIADKLIAKYDLMKVYNTESPERARKILADSTTISAGKDGLISIEVDSQDKPLSARLANGYVSELLTMTKSFALTEAGRRRQFFERQLIQTKNDLAASEQAFKGNMETRGVISVDADSRVAVETIGMLRAQVSAKEIQLSSLSAVVTPNNPEYKRVQEDINSLRAELSKLENGRPASLEGNEAAGAASKPAGLENIKVLRDVKYQQMLYEMLARSYETARLEEANEASLIQVLDVAIDPEKKSKPLRGLIAIAAALFGVVVALATVSLEMARTVAPDAAEQAAKWDRLRASLGLRRRKA